MTDYLLTKALNVISASRMRAQSVAEQNLAKLRKHDDYVQSETAVRNVTVELGLALGTEREKELRLEKQKLVREQRAIMKKYGMTSSDVTPQYSCTICGDTGYANGTRCSCLRNQLSKLLFSESNADVNMRFETSTENDVHNLLVYEKCKELCEKLGESKIKSVFITGKTGVGKTFLCNAIANKLTENGKNALYLTAYQLNSRLLECHLADLDRKQTILDGLTDADALIIDDLGTENILRNVTLEYMFLVLNERCLSGKLTVVSTNLNLTQLRERYEERIFSRIMANGTTVVAELNGRDKRVTTK